MKYVSSYVAMFLLQTTTIFGQQSCFSYEAWTPPACPRTPTLKAPNYHCSVPGSVKPFEPYVNSDNPWGAGEVCQANSEAECSAFCGSRNGQCKVYAYDTSSELCSLFEYAMKSKQFKKDTTSTTSFSRAGCATQSMLSEYNGIYFYNNFPGQMLSLTNSWGPGNQSAAPSPNTVSLDGIATDDDCSAAQNCVGQITNPITDGVAAYAYFLESTQTWMCDYWNSDISDELGIGQIADSDVGMTYFYWAGTG